MLFHILTMISVAVCCNIGFFVYAISEISHSEETPRTPSDNFDSYYDASNNEATNEATDEPQDISIMIPPPDSMIHHQNEVDPIDNVVRTLAIREEYF